MNKRHFLHTFLVSCLLLTGGAVRSQELYYGDDDDMSPEEYYLEGIGYGSDDYGSGGIEDSSASSLYSPSSSDSIYGGYTAEPATPSYDGYALPATPVTGGPGGGDSMDWFSMSGVALLEAVGTEESGRVLISKDVQGNYELLKVGETKAGAFKVLAIGEEQARIEPVSGGAPKVVPILHKSAPLDTFLAAVAKIQNLRLVIGKPLDQMVSFTEEMMDIEVGFNPLLAGANVFLKRLDDVVIVRGAPLLDAKTYEADSDLPEGDSVDLGHFRSNGDELVQIISKALPKGTKGGPDSLPKGTTAMLGATPAAEALYYLNLAWNTEITVDAPVATAKASSAMSKAKQDRLYALCIQAARQGDMKKAGRGLLKLCRSGSKEPAHFQALGKVYWKLGRIAPAVKAWKAAYRLDPQNATSRNLLVKAKRKVRAMRASRS